MPFQFSFSLPSFPNPFASSSTSEQSSSTLKDDSQREKDDLDRMHLPRLSPSPCPSTSTTNSTSVKRGWEPSYISGPSRASIATITTDGYLDTPAKYKEVAGLSSGHAEEQEMLEEMMEDLRPAKRRRTFTDSVVSTAYSAALISTAVGYTVYKYWRDGGKERTAAAAEHTYPSPPPPYEPQWTPINRIEITPPQNQTPPSTTPRYDRNLRPIVANSRVRKRHSVRKSLRRPKPKQSTSSLRTPVSTPRIHAPMPSSDGFEDTGDHDDETDEMGGQIDTMSARLARLIADGQRALNSEVVITSESREDEHDDGMGQWIDNDDQDDEDDYSGYNFSMDGRSSPSKTVYEDSSDLRSHPLPNTFLSPSRPGFPFRNSHPNPCPPGSFPGY